MNEKLLKPTYLKEFCQIYGIIPSKEYGQHYLISEKPILKIIEAGDLKETDTVVEIGPGFGVLTLAVAPLVKKVIAFEIEKKLEPYWEEKKKEFPNVEIVWGNFLHQWNGLSPYKGELEGVSSSSEPHLTSPYRGGIKSSYKVLANLPYQITSDAIRTILEAEQKPEKIVLMVQREVAERIIAKKGDMNLLALSVQVFGTPRIVCAVLAGSFWPAPKVDSAVLAIEQIQPIENETEFFRIARAGFSNPRKQLWGNIAHGLKMEDQAVKNAVQQATGNEKVRAEDLSMEEWRTLVRTLSGKPRDPSSSVDSSG